jgi:hypothetical protein
LFSNRKGSMSKINQGTEIVVEVTVKNQKWTCRKCGVVTNLPLVSKLNTCFTDYGDATNNVAEYIDDIRW